MLKVVNASIIIKVR